MPKSVPLPPPGFDDLSVNEKIDYVQSLWARIAATPESIPVPEWHHEILEERLRDLEADPEVGDSWDVVQGRLRAKLDPKHQLHEPSFHRSAARGSRPRAGRPLVR